MSKLSRSEQQNFKKQQHRAVGIMDAMYELAGLDPPYWPEGRVVETGAYQSARRLLLAGVEAARTGRKVTAAERKTVAFMLGYKVAGPAVVAGVVAADASSSKPKVRPPYNDPAPENWRQITIGGVTSWGCIDGDAVNLYLKEGKDWVNKATHRGVPMRGCPEWYEKFWGWVLLAGDPKKKSTISDLYEQVCDDEGDEPHPDVHPIIAALWRDIVAGIKAAESGAALPEGESTLAFRVGYEMTKSDAA
jgi:hypothetical protein